MSNNVHNVLDDWLLYEYISDYSDLWEIHGRGQCYSTVLLRRQSSDLDPIYFIPVADFGKTFGYFSLYDQNYFLIMANKTKKDHMSPRASTLGFVWIMRND